MECAGSSCRRHEGNATLIESGGRHRQARRQEHVLVYIGLACDRAWIKFNTIHRNLPKYDPSIYATASFKIASRT